MTVTADQILTAVFKKLDGDNTLKGVTYLNGSNKIEKGPFRKQDFVNPTIALKIGGAGMDTEVKVQDCTVYVMVYVDNNVNGTANTALLSKIAGAVEVLLENASLTAPTNTRFLNCYLTSPHQGAIYDEQHPDEHFTASVFRVQSLALT